MFRSLTFFSPCRHLLFVCLAGLLFFASPSFAQIPGGGGSTLSGTISGTIIDSATRKPVEYVTISITRKGGKAPLNGNISDSKGTFKLENIKPGDYTLHIAFIGYANKNVNVSTTPVKLDRNAGAIYLRPSSQMLGNVEVTAKKPLVENHIDKIVYNAEQDVTTTGGNATDVLQKVPLVAVDINGNVSLRGDPNVRVLINGKPSGMTSASLSDVLKTIPASQIKSIEVITSPSAKYDAEGTAGIINIITKQKNISGLSGSVSGGVGTRQNNGNFNLNYNKNRFSLTFNLGGNLAWPQRTPTSFDQNFLSGDTVTQRIMSTSVSSVKRYGGISSLTAGYDFNSYNNLSTTFKLNKGGFDIHGGSMNNFVNELTPAASFMYTGNSVSNNSFGGFDWNLDYTRKFKKEGHEFVLSGQWSHSLIKTDYSNIYSLQTINASNQKASNDGVNNEYTLQADYTLPMNKVLKLEAGAKSIFRKISSDFSLYKPQTMGSADSVNFILDPVNSNQYKYDQNVYAGYAVFTITLPKSFTLMPGARLENTAIKGDPQNALQINLDPFTQNYNTFVPNLTIQKAFGASQTLKLTYSKRITRPSLTYLNPFLNASNPNSQTQGNPSLAPEIVQTVEMNYNTFIKTSIINASVYYRNTTGLIQGIATPLDSSIGIGTITRYYNIGKNNSFGASFFGSVTPISILTIRGSINGYTYQNQSTAAFSSQQTQNGTYLAYTGFLSGSLTLKSGFIVEVFGFTNSIKHTIQGTTPGFSIMGLGVKQQVLHKKGSVGISSLDPFNKYLHFNSASSSPGFNQSQKVSYPIRSFGVNFSYSFGKTTFSNPQKKQGLNDDMKQGDQGGGPGGAPGQ